MTKQTKEHYDQLWKECENTEKLMDQMGRIADAYKELYEKTKNRKGIYRLINKFAYKENQKWFEKGMLLGLRQLGVMGSEFDQLMDIMKKKDKESGA